MRQRTIIGVLGGSTDVPADATKLAREAGSAIAVRGAIVLTGGDGRSGDSKNVKDAAVYGARGGRVISILKGGDGLRRVDKHLVVHSGMRDARNVLNGFTADVLIALPGGGGTLTEIAFAAIAGRPNHLPRRIARSAGRIDRRHGEDRRGSRRHFRRPRPRRPHSSPRPLP
jgi:uncharacterized protein (TIGR00725 family)